MNVLGPLVCAILACGSAVGVQTFMAPSQPVAADAETMRFQDLSEPITAVLVTAGTRRAYVSVFVSVHGKTAGILPAEAQIASYLGRMLREKPFDPTAFVLDKDGRSQPLARHLEAVLSAAPSLEGMTVRVREAFIVPAD